MTSKCSDPNYILKSPECKSMDVDAYNEYIKQMNNYCSKEANTIANPNCIDYINNNKFIQLEDFTKIFKKNASDLCLNNLNPLYDSNCIQSYKIKPLDLIRREEVEIQEKAAADTKEMILWILIGLTILALVSGIIFLIYNKRKKNTQQLIDDDNNRKDILDVQDVPDVQDTQDTQ
jgi:hypothetical protein